MDTLVAAAEVEPDGLDWEPELRRLPMKWEGDPPVWAIFDEARIKVDGSHDPANHLGEYSAPSQESESERFRADWSGTEWLIARRTVRHPHPEVVLALPMERRKERHQTLVFIAAVPKTPVYSTLLALGWALGGTSLGLWVVAAVVGRRLARQALSPLTAMSVTANSLTAHDVDGRLPNPGTDDELESLVNAFNGLLARLHDAFERQRQFTGEASHQLRTPLTAMIGQMEVALRRDRDTEEYRRSLTSAVAQARRLHQIVESLLFLARANAESRLPDLVELDLEPWLHDHFKEVWSGHSRFADLRVEVSGRPFAVCVQPALLGQAVHNLLDNALKYSLNGTPVVIHLGRENQEVTLAVEDQGTGISNEDVERIFEPFFRSTEVRRAGVSGVGLGLAVVARIVAAFGGRITTEARPSGGSRFIVSLPESKGA
jgi:heavy metal sensor kinase